MSVFHQHAKNVSKYHRHDYRDLLRIFFKDPNVSDKEIDMFLERKTLKDILPEEDYSKRDYNYMNDEAMFMEDPLNCKQLNPKSVESINIRGGNFRGFLIFFNRFTGSYWKVISWIALNRNSNLYEQCFNNVIIM